MLSFVEDCLFWSPTYFKDYWTFTRKRQKSMFIVIPFHQWNLIRRKHFHVADFERLTENFFICDWFVANVPLSLLLVQVEIMSWSMVCWKRNMEWIIVKTLIDTVNIYEKINTYDCENCILFKLLLVLFVGLGLVFDFLRLLIFSRSWNTTIKQ